MKPPKPHRHGNHRWSGFTLMEVLVTLAVIAMVIGFAAPTLQNLAPGMKLKGTARNLYSTLQNMRQTAIKENRTVYVKFDQAGFFYLDPDQDGYTAGDRQFPFEAGVRYGSGNAPQSWSGAAIQQATGISFDNRGLPTVTPVTPGSDTAVFLDYVDAAGNNLGTCYAVNVATSGSIQLHKWNGNQWD